MLEIHNLRFAWPRAEADCISIDSLTLSAGKTLFLHGPSGTGKSTLLGLLAGVLLPRSGHVSVMGSSWSSLSSAQRDAFRANHVGYIFQQFNLLPYLSALDNVLLPCRFSEPRRAHAAETDGSPRTQAVRLMQLMELDESLWARPASQLSVGQQQRVAAARALIGGPELVIADEPTSALDAALRNAFMTLLLGACRNAGSTLVFVSHDERLAARFDSMLSLSEINHVPATEAPSEESV